MSLTLSPEALVELCRQAMGTHVLHCLVQLLEAIGDWPLSVDSTDRFTELLPSLSLIVLR